MATYFATSITNELDSYKAGQEVAKVAFSKINKKKPDLALIFASPQYDYSEVMKAIKDTVGDVPVVGCSSSGEFTDERVTSKGIAFALIASDTHRFFSGIGPNIKKNQIHAIQTASANFPHTIEGYPYHSAMLFLDGLAGKGEETVLAAASILGPMVKFSGGAAGDDLNFKQTKVFGNGLALTDAVSLCFMASSKPIIISVKHGHKPLSPPLRITKAKESILYEIEGKPALDVWKYYLKDKVKEAGMDFATMHADDISKILLKHEAGLLTGSDYKMRFPSSSNPDGSLNFVCTIVEGSVIQIMDSNDDEQIKSAKQAAQIAISNAKGAKIAGAIIFDCVCRSMLLKDKFQDAIDEIKKTLGDIPLIGFETYGEVAMEMNQLSGFHNATTVIMLLPN